MAEDLGGEWQFLGLKNGFQAFKSGDIYPLTAELLNPHLAGFYAGATRETLLKKDGSPDEEKLDRAAGFVKAAHLDYLVGSAGDDHGNQMEILRQKLEAEGIGCKVLVVSKTMDGDKGGRDGEVVNGYTGPFADTTNGFHAAVNVGVAEILNHHSGAWTNETATIISHFGRDANWVGLALSWYGHGDVFLAGELPKEHPGHSIERIAELTHANMEENQRMYGRRFATIIAPEGTKIEGIEHVSETLKDAHGHKKLNPELLVVGLKEALEEYGIKSQTGVVAYDMRNFPPSKADLRFAEITGREIANAMREGTTGMEAVLLFKEGMVYSDMRPTSLASRKRLASYYPKPLHDPETLRVLPSVGEYFMPLFGPRKEKESFLQTKPHVVNVYKN